MDRRRLGLSVGAFCIAAAASARCGDGPDQQGDATSDVTADNVMSTDVSQTDVTDGSSSTDVSSDVDAGFPYPLAFWSLRYEHVGYGDLGDNLHGPLCVVGQAASTADFGAGAVGATAAVSVALNYIDGGAAYAPLNQTIGIFADGQLTGDVTYQATGQYHELDLRNVVKRTMLSAYACSKSYASTPPVSYLTYGTDASVGRYHHTLEKGDVKAFDGVLVGSQDTPALVQLNPGELIVEFGSANTNVLTRFGDASTYNVAIDVVSAAAASTVIVVAGRMSGGFDFGNGLVSGDGYFILGLKPSDLSVSWIKVLGGTPLQPVSSGPAAAEGTSIRIVNSGVPAFVVTVPFSGTLNLGTTQLSGPAQGEATAVFGMDTSGTVTWSKAFKKGPASAGKLSRPSVMPFYNQGNFYRLFDTVWDSMDFGGQTVQASAGADVVVADLDSQGNIVSSRVYGGPGDDEAYRIRGSGLTDCFVVGHSAQSIDFGNGPLTTTAAEGELWVARLP